jgi:hypothetical protein
MILRQNSFFCRHLSSAVGLLPVLWTPAVSPLDCELREMAPRSRWVARVAPRGSGLARWPTRRHGRAQPPVARGW